MSKSKKSSSEKTPAITDVILLGPDNPGIIEEWHEEFKDNPQVLIIGNGTRKLTDADLETLQKQKLSSNGVHIHYLIHGNNIMGQHCLELEEADIMHRSDDYIARVDQAVTEAVVGRFKGALAGVSRNMQEFEGKGFNAFARKLGEVAGGVGKQKVGNTHHVYACYSGNVRGSGVSEDTIVCTYSPSDRKSLTALNKKSISHNIKHHQEGYSLFYTFLNNSEINPTTSTLRLMVRNEKEHVTIGTPGDAVSDPDELRDHFKANRVAFNSFLSAIGQPTVTSEVDRGEQDLQQYMVAHTVVAFFEGKDAAKRAIQSRPELVNKPLLRGGNMLYLVAAGATGGDLDLLLAVPDLDVNGISPQYVPLHAAIDKGNNIVIERLVAREDLDVNKTNAVDGSPLLVAIHKGNVKAVELLLTRDDLEIEKGYLDTTPVRPGEMPREPLTPLMLALQKGQSEIAKMLLEKGANVNVTFQGATALHQAAANCDSSVVELMVAKGAEINKTDMFGLTPVDAAILENNPKNARLLLDKAKEQGVVFDETTKARFAANAPSEEMKDLLQERGIASVVKKEKEQEDGSDIEADDREAVRKTKATKQEKGKGSKGEKGRGRENREGLEDEGKEELGQHTRGLLQRRRHRRSKGGAATPHRPA